MTLTASGRPAADSLRPTMPLVALSQTMPLRGHAREHVDMEPLVIGSAERTLVLSDPQSYGALPADYLSITLSGPDLRASRQVYAGWENGFTDLATFFTDLAEGWRGWQGERVFESIEGDLRIQATHDGPVNLRVLLRESTVPDGWEVQAVVRLDAGKALSDAAVEVSLLVLGPVR